MVGFADDEFDTGEHVLLSKLVSPTAQDVALGQQGVQIIYGDQSRSAYGGITKLALGNGVADIFLDARSAALVGASHIRITFAVDSPSLEEVRVYLHRLFADEVGVLTIDD